MSRVREIEIISPLDAKGHIEVALQDQFTEIVDLHFTQEQDTFTLAVDAVADAMSFTATGGHSITVGEMLCFQEGARFMQAEVLSVVTNAIGIDSPFDFAFTTAATCSNDDFNLNVNGSVTPQIFKVSPVNLQAGSSWDITRVIFVIEDGTIMDTGTFGGIAALTNGVVLRVNNGNNKNIFNAKTNGDFASHSFDVAYDDRAPAGAFGFRCRTTFAGPDKRGVTIRLSTDDSDALELWVQDNLTALSNFNVIAQGHVVEG